jgi:hypothetical protein
MIDRSLKAASKSEPKNLPPLLPNLILFIRNPQTAVVAEVVVAMVGLVMDTNALLWTLFNSLLLSFSCVLFFFGGGARNAITFLLCYVLLFYSNEAFIYYLLFFQSSIFSSSVRIITVVVLYFFAFIFYYTNVQPGKFK